MQKINEHEVLREKLSKIIEMIKTIDKMLLSTAPEDQAHLYFQEVFDSYHNLQNEVAQLEKNLLVLENIITDGNLSGSLNN